MVEGWEERREAADSVFLFPVVCWLSVMRPHLRPQHPAIGQGIRWLPQDARRAGPPRQAETQKKDQFSETMEKRRASCNDRSSSDAHQANP